MPDIEFESDILRFELRWQRDDPPEIGDFLDCARASSRPERLRLLIELICINLEFRWRSSTRNPPARERNSLEAYVAKFLEIGSLDRLPLELIGEEYRVPRIWGDRPSHAEFLSRFDSRQAEFRAHLLQVDSEIEAESIDAHVVVSAREPSSRPLDPPDQTLVGRLLSHRHVLLQRMIGAGQMGKVYQAWYPRENHAVAVKFLRAYALDGRGRGDGPIHGSGTGLSKLETSRRAH